MLAAFSSVVGNVTDFGKGLANIVTSTVFGSNSEKKVNKVLESDMGESKVTNSPLMKGLLSLVSEIDVAVKGEETGSSAIEIRVKDQISEILLQIIDQRQDFLIQNFLSWFEEILAKEGKRIDFANPMGTAEILLEYINSQGLSVLPPTMKTGIAEIDEKYGPKVS